MVFVTGVGRVPVPIGRRLPEPVGTTAVPVGKGAVPLGPKGPVPVLTGPMPVPVPIGPSPVPVLKGPREPEPVGPRLKREEKG